MRHRMWAALVAVTPPLLWSSPDDARAWFARDTLSIAAARSLTSPEEMRRAAQAMEYHGHLQQAHELYTRAAEALPAEHPLTDDLVVSLRIIDEKLADQSRAKIQASESVSAAPLRPRTAR